MKDFKELSLLYIDDEDEIRKNATEYLKKIFSEVFEAKDGLEGLELYKQMRPDIIITDIKMPKINGLEFAKRVREDDSNTPIIIATAFTDTEYLLQAVELQLIKYLIKPISSYKLHEALRLSLLKKGVVHFDESVVYDSLNKVLIINNTPIRLTKNELLLLDLLVKNKDRVTTYSEIENYIWHSEGMSIDALRTLVKSLRKKMKKDFIQNLSGVGYKIKNS